jgi:hypothetical protein
MISQGLPECKQKSVFLPLFYKISLMQRRIKKRGLSARRRDADIIDKHGILPDALDLVPPDDRIRFPAQKAEEPRSAVNNKRAYHRRAGIQFHIAHAAETGAVANIYDLLAAKIHQAADH